MVMVSDEKHIHIKMWTLEHSGWVWHYEHLLQFAAAMYDKASRRALKQGTYLKSYQLRVVFRLLDK